MKVVIKNDKVWFERFGLHHALIAAVFTAIGHFIGFGGYFSMFAAGYFLGREYKEYTLRGAFEIMDFISPVIVTASYLFWSN